MCYDLEYQLEKQIELALRQGDVSRAQELKAALEPLIHPVQIPMFHVNGFSHPELVIFTEPILRGPKLATWGLIPHWVKDSTQKTKMQRMTLNARLESIFDKPSFRRSSMTNRCVLLVMGFYEHQHRSGKKTAYHISRKDGEPMRLAVLWSEWVAKDTGEIITSFTIVTTEANCRMAEIHNNPKLREPRMPFILDETTEVGWMTGILEDRDAERKRINGLLRNFDDSMYNDHPVRPLRGKHYVGNVPAVKESA